MPFVIIGGVAASLLGSPMATLDLYVCAPLDHALAVKIVEALEDANPRFAMRPDLPVVTPDNHNLRLLKHLYLLSDLGRLDVLSEVEGIGDYAACFQRSVQMTLAESLICRVLNIDALIAAKTTAGREKDIIGVRHLEVVKRRKQQQPELFDDQSK